MIAASRAFIPVFVDTLSDLKTTRQFGERIGSYPVLRVLDAEGRDVRPRIDTNPTAGEVPVARLLKQLRPASTR